MSQREEPKGLGCQRNLIDTGRVTGNSATACGSCHSTDAAAMTELVLRNLDELTSNTLSTPGIAPTR